jgi:gas vesicle protein
MARQTESASSFVGTLLVFATGVACGLLFAKQTGEETREQLADLINKGKQKGQELMAKGSDELQRQKEKMSSEGGKEPFYESGKYT